MFRKLASDILAAVKAGDFFAAFLAFGELVKLLSAEPPVVAAAQQAKGKRKKIDALKTLQAIVDAPEAPEGAQAGLFTDLLGNASARAFLTALLAQLLAKFGNPAAG